MTSALEMDTEALLLHILTDIKDEYRILLNQCESPIERHLVAGLIANGMISTVRMQFPIGPYRVDIAVQTAHSNVVVEADGLEYHHGTKERVERDYARDRYLQSQGWRVLRFSGSEIVRDVQVCVDQIKRVLFHAEKAAFYRNNPDHPRW